MSLVKRKERGWAGHFMLGDRCAFHLNTLLQYNDKKLIVSTVGRLINFYENKIDIIGCDRYYETMVFESNYDEYDDIDVHKRVEFESDWAINKIQGDNEACEMHEQVVKEISDQLINDNIKFED